MVSVVWSVNQHVAGLLWDYVLGCREGCISQVLSQIRYVRIFVDLFDADGFYFLHFVSIEWVQSSNSPIFHKQLMTILLHRNLNSIDLFSNLIYLCILEEMYHNVYTDDVLYFDISFSVLCQYFTELWMDVNVLISEYV